MPSIAYSVLIWHDCQARHGAGDNAGGHWPFGLGGSRGKVGENRWSLQHLPRKAARDAGVGGGVSDVLHRGLKDTRAVWYIVAYCCAFFLDGWRMINIEFHA